MQLDFDDNFIAQVQNNLESLCVERMTKIAITIHNRLSIETPVDTGQAHAGWNFTLNKKNMDRPPKLTYQQRKAGVKIPRQESQPDSIAREFSDRYHLVNAVEHIIYLNEGHSDKAPANFIEKEIVAAIKDVEG